jgi:hypothetical protein
MGGKSRSAPPPVIVEQPASVAPAFDPGAILAPMMGMMNQMMSSFMQQQQSYLQNLSFDPTSSIPDYTPPPVDWEQRRADILASLERNPSDERRLRGRASTVRTNPLEMESATILDLNLEALPSAPSPNR